MYIQLNVHKDPIMTEATQEQATEENTVEFNILTFTNNKPDPAAESLLRLFYEGAITNTIGVMRAAHIDTGEEVLLLVGVAPKENGASDVFPLAKVLTHNDAFAYKSPDGKGGWFAPEPIAKEANE